MTQSDFYTILPLTILTIWACVLLLIDLFIPKDRKGITALLSALGLALTLGFTLSQIGREVTGFSGMVVLDGFSTFVNALLLVSGFLGIALAYGYVKRMGIERGEYYTLLLFSVTGMMLMAQATDLIVVFLALELLSIPLYVLAAFARPNVESEEAGIKYFPARRILNRICRLRDRPRLRRDWFNDLAAIFASASTGHPACFSPSAPP